MGGHAAAKAQGQNNKRTYAKALAGGQAKEPANKTARVEVKDKPRGFGRGLAAEKIIGLRREGKDNVQFLVKWRGTDETDFVHAKEAKELVLQPIPSLWDLYWYNIDTEASSH